MFLAVSMGAESVLYFLLGIFFLGMFWVFIAADIEDGHQKRKKREEYRKHREDAYRAKQEHICEWHRTRDEFEELRMTPEFRVWREEQYRCQDKKCAWCKKPIQCYSQYTHVDHIKPLFHGGTNNYWNLVLSCSYCNRRKGDWTTGWTGEPFEIAKHHTNRRPDWIKPNKHAYGVKLNAINATRNDSRNGLKTITNHKTRHKKPAPIVVEKAISKDSPMPPSEVNGISHTTRFKVHEPDSHDNIPKDKASDSCQKRPATTRQLNDKEQRYLLDIQRMLTDIRTNKPKTATSNPPVRPQYYFGPSYEGDELDRDNPEYISDQYMSFDYDDWMDKYGPEW